MGAGIIALLTALPELAKLLNQIGPELSNLIKQFVKWINHTTGNDPQGYIKKVGEAFSTLNNAQTEEERQKAAQAIAKAIRNLG